MNNFDISDSFLPFDYELVSVYDLHKAIAKIHGEEVAKSFDKLVMDKILPEDLEPLIDFFTGRTDEISKTCLAQLMSADQSRGS